MVTDPLHTQLTGVPKNSATVGVTWSPSQAWKTRLQGRYTGAMLLDTTSSAGVRFRARQQHGMGCQRRIPLQPVRRAVRARDQSVRPPVQ
ncbi:hypothetical protein LP419_40510 [Massilia sp. H-1]|nr:hypothetical protein LP419_40510 [Massilia sp. H-1]